MTVPVETPPVETPPVETSPPVESPPVETPAVTPEQAETVVDQWQGGLMTDAIRTMVGTPPPGFEFLEYAAGAGIYVLLVAIVASVFVGFSKFLGAK